MIRSFIRLAVVAWALLGAVAPAPAQDVAQLPAVTGAALPAQAPGTPGAAPVDATRREGVAAARPMAPRSMRPYWHVFIAFGLAWTLLLGYGISLRGRFSRLEEAVRRLGREA